jgi:hypothetical protein
MRQLKGASSHYVNQQLISAQLENVQLSPIVIKSCNKHVNVEKMEVD